MFGDNVFGCFFVFIKIVFLYKINCELRVKLIVNDDFCLTDVGFGDLFGGNLIILIPGFVVFVRLGECDIDEGARLINSN